MILDVNREQFIKWSNVRHFYNEVNQLYRPCWDWKLEQDYYDILLNSDWAINNIIFFPILIKEWYYLVKKWWYIIIQYYPDKVNPIDIEDELWKQWGWSYDIISHNVEDIILENEYIINEYINIQENKYNSNEDIWFDNFNDKKLLNQKWTIIIKKNISTLIDGDSINNWSFWIVTNWNRDEWLDDLIDSIKKQNIEKYEILICWKSEKYKDNKDIIFIPFNKRSNLWWLDKKKNLLIQKSKYQNIVIMHDRYVFDDNWFNWMKKWWNNFEYITNKQYYEWNENYPFIEIHWLNSYDYINEKNLRKRRWFLMYINNDDNFSKYWYLSWWLQITKKYFYNKVWLWNENLFWQEWEDVMLSKKFHSFWLYCRCNPYSIAYSKNYWNTKDFSELSFVWIKWKYNNLNWLFNINLSLINISKYIIFYISEKSLNNIFFNLIYLLLKKIRRLFK